MSPALARHIVVIPEIIPGDMTQISSFICQICHKDWRLSFGSQVSFPFSAFLLSWQHVTICQNDHGRCPVSQPATPESSISPITGGSVGRLLTGSGGERDQSWVGQTPAAWLLDMLLLHSAGLFPVVTGPLPASPRPRRRSIQAPILNCGIANASRQTGKQIWSTLSGSRRDITVAGSRWKDKLLEGSATVSVISH